MESLQKAREKLHTRQRSSVILLFSIMSRSRLTPILVYNIDLPFTSYSPAAHGHFKTNYISDKGDACMKFFELPVFVGLHAVVRGDEQKYGKTTFSVEPDESQFIRRVEKDIMDQYDRITDLAEPNMNVMNLPFKSVTYENLLKTRVNKTVGQDVNGMMVPAENHIDVLKNKTRLVATLEIHGVYHSPNGKGVISRLHSYVVQP